MGSKELDYLYENAKTIEIDDKSKMVFISDVHRGDGSHADSLLPNRNIYITALKYYLKNRYIYVEVGDGDELWKNKNCKEIAYFYQDIFKILNKYKDTIDIYLLYGNHDHYKRKTKFKIREVSILNKFGEDYGYEFINLLDKIEFYPAINCLYKAVNEKFLVTHGHQLDILNNELLMINKVLVRYIWKFMNGVAGFKDPNSSARVRKKRSRIDNKLQAWARDRGKMIVCGHTHNSRFPNYFEPPYFNDGCCVMPYGMTAIEIESGMISLVKWSIDVKDNGVLWVKRRVIEGPAILSKYLLWAQAERNKRK